MSNTYVWQEIIQSIQGLPRYLVGLIGGLLVAIFTNPPVSVLAASTLAGCTVLPTGAVLAASGVIYVIVFAVNNVANAIGQSNTAVARAIAAHAAVFAQTTQDDPSAV